MSNPIGCFYLETSFVLADILGEPSRELRVDKLKKDSNRYNIPCYVSESVKKETYKKVQEVINFLGNTVRNTITYKIEESRKIKNISLTKPINSNDIREMEKYFASLYIALKSQGKSDLIPSPVRFIEDWTISYLSEELERGVKIDIKDFKAKFIKNLLVFSSTFENLYDDLLEFQRGYIKIKRDSADLLAKAWLEARTSVHDPDSHHLACAISNQKNNNQKTVFVTFDYGTILNERDAILRKFNLCCCDPLYAIFHLI